MTLTSGRFGEFHHALYGYEAFPWQQMLAEQVEADGWPGCIDLPTASGKTACIDIAVFTLACQADRSLADRTAPRRIFFVVDRRIVVDAAFTRADALAKQLRKADGGVLREVADRLRALHGGVDPLAVARIRGGVARDDGWIRSPTQAAVITGTVDQVGSRLLFRAYGPGQLSAPIHAALVAQDSLIVLDEAHCAVPFFQTAKSVERYRGAEWAEQLLPSPFRVVVMSATPPAEVESVFPERNARAAALDHPKLHQRISSAKPAELAVATRPANPRHGSAGLRSQPVSEDELVLDTADRAIRLAAERCRRIAIMVNRVATARAIHAQLRAEGANDDDPLDADVVLITGRMRPLDRDDLVERWEKALLAKDEQPALDRPIILVTTQCLEVGADFSFDALITECASLDALRQRFGRLDRLGTVAAPHAAVLIRKLQLKEENDPIYGAALAATWAWLNEHAVERDGTREFDFGIAAVDALVPTDIEDRREQLRPMLAPAPDAPVMLPTHLDCWVQTAPCPRPDPDVAVFLHGPGRGVPDVYAVLRADLELEHVDERNWIETVSLCPPSSLEAFAVPLHIARRWLSGDEAVADDLGDVEGGVVPALGEEGRGQRAVLAWRGRDKSRIVRDPADLRSHDVVIVPAAYTNLDMLGDMPSASVGLDLGDFASLASRGRAMLRLDKKVYGGLARHPLIAELLSWREGEDAAAGHERPTDLLRAVAGATDPVRLEDGTEVLPPPERMRLAAAHLAADCQVLNERVLVSRRRARLDEPVELEGSADEDDITSEASGEVALEEHLEAVAAVASDFAGRSLPDDKAEPVVRAARLHDLGKADWRFQVMLHRGNELEAYRRGELLAKSPGVPRSLAARQRARRLAQLPDGFRHEMASVQAVEADPELMADVDADLVLHLIASHHGHARPFTAVVLDEDPPDLEVAALGRTIRLPAEQRRDLVPPHRLDSGIAERFWRLTRRYGWWGLAYLEVMVRLADWEASERHEQAIARVQPEAEEVA